MPKIKSRWLISIFLFLTIPLLLAASRDKNQFLSMQVGHVSSSSKAAKNSKQRWQLSLAFKRKPDCHLYRLSKPYRLVADCNHAQKQASVSKLLWRGTPIKAFRTGMHKDKLRLVWEFANPFTFKYAIASDVVKSNKLNITINTINSKKSNNISNNKNSTNKKNNNKKSSAPILSIRPTVILIDPGHGGKDPGATSVNGVHEKNVVLAISRYLKRDLQRKPGYKVYLTRNRDVYLTLRQRLRVARKYHADMFVAIHADAYRNSSARGASVFALSLRGATSEAARWLAERENASELIGGVNLSNKDRMLRSVLLDLSQTATIRSSLKIGNSVIDTLSKVSSLHHFKVEQAAFVVLKSPDIPSLLIETGFLSNRREARLLQTSAYQKKMAAAISHGITNYFSVYPLPGTWLAARKNGKFASYKVQRGDSLSKIAFQFEVSIKQLKNLNHLNGEHIRVGQVLQIPEALSMGSG